MTNPNVVVDSVQRQPYTKEYIAQLRREVMANMDKITKKPTLQDLFAMVDQCWNDKVFLHQTRFENKDQHYAYITEYYKEQIEPMTLEQYKQLVCADLMAKLDTAEALLDSDKILYAAKEHKKHAEALSQQYKQEFDDLKHRNEETRLDK